MIAFGKKKIFHFCYKLGESWDANKISVTINGMHYRQTIKNVLWFKLEEIDTDDYNNQLSDIPV